MWGFGYTGLSIKYKSTTIQHSQICTSPGSAELKDVNTLFGNLHKINKKETKKSHLSKNLVYKCQESWIIISSNTNIANKYSKNVYSHSKLCCKDNA